MWGKVVGGFRMRLPVILNVNLQVQDQDGVVVCDLYRNPRAEEDGREIVRLLNGNEVKVVSNVDAFRGSGNPMIEAPVVALGADVIKEGNGELEKEELKVLKVGRITRRGKQWTEERKREHGRKVKEAHERRRLKGR